MITQTAPATTDWVAATTQTPTYRDAAERRIVVLPDGRIAVLVCVSRKDRADVRFTTGSYLTIPVGSLRLADREPLHLARRHGGATYRRALAAVEDSTLRAEHDRAAQDLAGHSSPATRELAWLVASEMAARQRARATAS